MLGIRIGRIQAGSWRVFALTAAIGLIFAISCGSSEEATPTPTATTAAPGAAATPTRVPAEDTYDEGPVYGGTITLPGDIRYLDNGSTQEGQSWSGNGMTSNVFSQLIRFDLIDRSTIEGDMAESWSVSTDGTVYTFKIRDNIIDHEGNPYGAEEIAYQIYRYVDKPNGFPARRQPCMASGLKPVGGWPPPGGTGVDFNKQTNEVTIRLKSPLPWILACFAQGFGGFGPMKYYLPIDQSGTYRPLDPSAGESIGTGPFKVVEYIEQDRVIIERNDQYFIEGKPYVDRVEVFNILESSGKVAAYRAGRVESFCCYSVPSVIDNASLKKEFGDGIVIPLALAVGWKGEMLNVQRPPFGPQDDPTAKQIRWALQLWLDRDAINNVVEQGIGFRSNYLLFTWDWIRDDWNDLPGFSTERKAEDRAEAQDIMRSLGYGPDNLLEFGLNCSGRGAGQRECEYLAEDLKGLYMAPDAQIISGTFSSRDENAKGNFDMTPEAFGFGYDVPQVYLANVFMPRDEFGNFNWPRWENPRFSELYLQQVSLPMGDLVKGRILKEMTDILHEEAAFLPSIRPGLLHSFSGQWRGWVPARIHTSNLSLENVWLSSDENATEVMLQKWDVFTDPGPYAGYRRTSGRAKVDTAVFLAFMNR